MQRQLLDGVFINELDGCNIIEIKEFSDELKNKIKDELTVICHGECALTGITNYYSFEKTILELVNYRLSSDRKKESRSNWRVAIKCYNSNARGVGNRFSFL